MREILFRGKIENNGRWIGGYYVKAADYLTGEEIHAILPIDLELFPRSEFSSYEDVIPETVGQWTGLTDKNGKKIFEGDVVRDCDDHPAIVKFGRHSIPCCGCCYTWHDSVGFYLDFGKYIGSDEHIFDDLEVIGDIHDNPKWITRIESQN